MMRRILVALDASPRSQHVLAVARQLGDLAQAELRLFHVLYIPVDIPPAGRTAPDDAEIHERARAHCELAQLASGYARIHVERPVLADQAIWRMIVDRADQPDIDLLVMGSHGYGSLERLLGTTAAQVVNHCKRNVLIVRSTS